MSVEWKAESKDLESGKQTQCKNSILKTLLKILFW